MNERATNAGPVPLKLAVEALWMLLKADAVIKAGFNVLGRHMRMNVARNVPTDADDTIALASMLRKRGVEADLQIGVRTPPFESHAWVEVTERVINDMEGVRETYPTLHEFKNAKGSDGDRNDR